jgi:hypothetical protein
MHECCNMLLSNSDRRAIRFGGLDRDHSFSPEHQEMCAVRCIATAKAMSVDSIWTVPRPHIDCANVWQQTCTQCSCMCRHGCAYLLDVARSEAALVATFFPGPEASGNLASLIESLCNALYDSLRPQFIQLHSLDDLADLVLVLRDAVRADAASHRDAPSSVLLESTVRRITADVQERLLFRAMVCTRVLSLFA